MAFQEVVDKVCQIYDGEKCAEVIQKLINEETKSGGRKKSALWNMLKSLLAFDEQFKYCCERALLSSDTIPSRPTTSAYVEGPNPRKRKIDSESLEQYPVDDKLVAKIRSYALYYNGKDDNLKRCAVPLTARLIATYRHGENKNLKIDDEIIVRSWTNADFEVTTRVVKILEDFDIIVLKSNVDVCGVNNFANSIAPKMGMRYLLMGFSIIHNKTNHLSYSTGIIASDRPRRSCYTGTSGSYKGDSGGGCWSKDGRLMGIQVHTSDNGPASPAVGGRCLIVPVLCFQSAIEDLLPEEEQNDEVEWND